MSTINRLRQSRMFCIPLLFLAMAIVPTVLGNPPVESRFEQQLPGPTPQVPSNPNPPPSIPAGDPTVPSPRIRELMNKAPTEAKAATKYPTITLKGRVIGKDKPATAILEIDSKIYTVTQGMNIVIGNHQILKVTEISTKNVLIQLDGSEVFGIN